MTSANGQVSSDSVNLGSNPGSPATTNADVSGVSRDLSRPEKSELPEQTAHTGRTETGTALEAVADAIDEARYRHPTHPRERPRPFSDADEGDREYATRLARAALAAQWQPIKTAPKNGSDVLLYWPLGGLSETFDRRIIGRWSDFQQAWVWQGRAVRSYSREYQPSHWQPLPAPPHTESQP